MHASSKIESVSASSNLEKGIGAIKARNYKSAIEYLQAEIKRSQLATKDAKEDIHRQLYPCYRLLSLAYAGLEAQSAEDKIENLKQAIEALNKVTQLTKADNERIVLLQKTLEALTLNQRLKSHLITMPSPSVEKKSDADNQIKPVSDVSPPVKRKPKKKQADFIKEPWSSAINFSSQKELENNQREKKKREEELTQLLSEIKEKVKFIDEHSQYKYSKTYIEKARKSDNDKIIKMKEAYVSKNNRYIFETSRNDIEELNEVNAKITKDVGILDSIKSQLDEVISNIKANKENNKISPKVIAEEKPSVAKPNHGKENSKLQKKREQQAKHRKERELKQEQEKRKKELELKRKQEAEKLLETKRKQEAEEKHKLETFKKQKQVERREKELAAERERLEKEKALAIQKEQEEARKKQAEQELEKQKKLDEERKALEKEKEEERQKIKIERLIAMVEKEGERFRKLNGLANSTRAEGEPVRGENELAEHKRSEGEPVRGETEASEQNILADEKTKKVTKESKHIDRALLHLLHVKKYLSLPEPEEIDKNIKFYAILYHLTIVIQELTVCYLLNNVSSEKYQDALSRMSKMVISKLINVDSCEDRSSLMYRNILSILSEVQSFERGMIEKLDLFKKISSFFVNEKSLNQQNVFDEHFKVLKEIFNKINPTYLSAGSIISHIKERYPYYLDAIKILVIIVGESGDNLKSHRNISDGYSSLVEKVSCILRTHIDTEIQHIFEFCKLLKINHDNGNSVIPRGFFANIAVASTAASVMPQFVYNKK